MKFIIMMIFLFLTACSTIKETKISDFEIKQEYILPDLSSCNDDIQLNSKKISDLFIYANDLKIALKYCSNKNQEKNEWFKRNFPDYFN